MNLTNTSNEKGNISGFAGYRNSLSKEVILNFQMIWI